MDLSQIIGINAPCSVHDRTDDPKYKCGHTQVEVEYMSLEFRGKGQC